MEHGATRQAVPVLVGTVLGIACYFADRLDGSARLVLQFVASTGFAWGCAAFVTAVPARTRTAAVRASVTVLCAATVCYYAANLCSGAGPLGPVAVAAAYWLSASVAGGALLGVLAHTVRTGPPLPAAAAAGLVCGMLAGAGVAIVVALIAAGDDGRIRFAEAFLQAAAGVAVATWVFGRRRDLRPWTAYAVAAVLACTAGAATWTAVESVHVIGF